ncbi:hypothetical protein [Neisseria leonii]|uniref:hypothetical protein n=1 Tax=Neisseria leonii TaxID=2995413 RepID=UPI00237B5F57|nr:hypothetical protein [Neisseria sp. 3986]MDD9326222.1 hypothetical protein [Neisseria sp. 3986]
MFWELVATVSAALGFAGVALSVKWFWKRAPRWLVPVSAALGVMVFQVYQEYTWYSHTASRLPAGAEVVAESKETRFYRPWSYIKPQVSRFIAADTGNIVPNHTYPHWKKVTLYFFERGQPAHSLPVLVDCADGVQADAAGSAPVWGKTAYTGKLVGVVCTAG